MIPKVFVYDVFKDFGDDGGKRDRGIIGWVGLVICFENRSDVCTKLVGWERGCS